mmetsp:Transcript_14218/g.22630  ORF Transcript_14218/g.22630 Transcript_14218/m.22630 type:complete len:95 (+) Transcript_14218:1250-1534(+)
MCVRLLHVCEREREREYLRWGFFFFQFSFNIRNFTQIGQPRVSCAIMQMLRFMCMDPCLYFKMYVVVYTGAMLSGTTLSHLSDLSLSLSLSLNI